jgi:hypothetical protein
LAPLQVFLHVRVLEGWFRGGDDRLCQPPDEARVGQQKHLVLIDQLEQRLAQGVVLSEE